MTTQLRNGEFVEVSTRTFSTAFNGPQVAQFKDKASLMTRRSQRASRRAARAV